ncbi:MAG: nitrite/sulfite reductase [Acidobacteriia bacterium]|nr:nitrite/sulfite reductase [Terriglobia bacterium]
MATKESKAQRVERLKREKNPWDALEEIRGFARTGFPAIPPEWLGTYLRWWGVYTQGDGAGVVGGHNGEGKALPYFMVRIRIPNGILRAAQLRAIADLSRRFGRGVADITVRQNIQLHWVTPESLPEVLQTLEQQGLTTLGACGDVVRNITGCPVAGVDADEICDPSPLAMEASRLLAGNAEFYNLPRKFKVSLTGCRAWCSYPEINDVGLTAITRSFRGQLETGFSLRVGGGLSTDPHLAVRLNAFVRWPQVVDVIRGVAELFRATTSLREHRERARLKFLFLREGWSAEAFQRELERLLGFELDPAEPEHPPQDNYRDHLGIHSQKQEGLCFVGAAVVRGRVSWEQLHAAAELSERHASGDLRTTAMQNLLIVNSRWLTEELDDRLPGFDQDFKLHVTGCPNSCGQHWIADIGLEGKKLKVNGSFVDAYYFCVGGAVGSFPTIARPVGYRCAAQQVPDAIERLLRTYRATREPGENLRRFFGRHSDAELRQFLAGEQVEPVERDRPAAPVPQAVEG